MGRQTPPGCQKTKSVRNGPVPALFGFAVRRVLSAEPAVFVHFQPVRIVLFVFLRVVVSLLAFGASQGDFNSHTGTSRLLLPPSCRRRFFGATRPRRQTNSRKPAALAFILKH